MSGDLSWARELAHRDAIAWRSLGGDRREGQVLANNGSRLLVTTEIVPALSGVPILVEYNQLIEPLSFVDTRCSRGD